MIRPDIDARLAERLREVAAMQSDSEVPEWLAATNMIGRRSGCSAEEKANVINIAADLLEEYIMAHRERGQ